jgi:hypothetical protein
MDYKMHEAVVETIRETERSMRVSVKIPRDEADRIVVSRLIEIRNSIVNERKDVSHFDKVIKHYLTTDEFQKYVIDKRDMEY